MLKKILNGLCIFVEDDGIGIPEKHLGEVFELGFSTQERQESPFGMSQGMGLHFCRVALSRLGGSVNILNNGKHGSTFEIFLPLIEAK